MGNYKQADVIQWYVPEIPAKLSFAGEKVPLEKLEIREQLDREFGLIYYQHGSNFYIQKLMKRYFPVIEDILKENGVPDDFKYLCIAESNLQNLISRSGAVGFWQFMESTATEYDMEVNNTVDERYNIIKSTNAACDYFKKAHDKFGSWTAAAASYNCGMGGYNSRATAQQTMNYYDLYLPEETNKYIFRILSFKYLFEHAGELGYFLNDSLAYQPGQVRVIEVTRTIPNLPSFAIQQGITYKTLKLYNPWIRGYSLPVQGSKTYKLNLPLNTKE